eukprot:symbB.v1.2.035396.t1/scaffold4755.1/size35387/2
MCVASNAAVREEWPVALDMLSAMRWSTLLPNAVTFGVLGGAASSASAWCAAVRCVERCYKVLQCNAVHFSHAIASVTWPLAVTLLEAMKLHHLTSTISTNNALNLYAQSLQWHRVLQHLHRPFSGTTVSFGTALASCEGDGWPKAFLLWEKLRSNTLQVSQVLFGSLCSAFYPRWLCAVQLLQNGQRWRWGNVLSYSTVVSSCENALQWPLALNLRSTISNENVALTEGDVVLESAIISAWEKGKDWQRALQVLIDLRGNGAANDVSYGAAISACESSEEWQTAIVLLTDMRAEKLQVSVVTFNAAIQACQKCRCWKQALHLLQEMQSCNKQPNLVTYNGVLAACSMSLAWQEALHVFFHMTKAVDAAEFGLDNLWRRANSRPQEVPVPLFKKGEQTGLLNITIALQGLGLSAAGGPPPGGFGTPVNQMNLDPYSPQSAQGGPARIGNPVTFVCEGQQWPLP